MTCPLLRRAHAPGCRAVAFGSEPLPRAVLAAYCRGAYGSCPAYRYVRASGHLLNPADFRAWVVRGVAPGRIEPSPEGPLGPDAA